MSYIQTGVHDDWFPSTNGFRFAADQRVWYHDGKHDSICSVDLQTMQVRKHLVDDSICEFAIFGDLAAVGTIDGRVWTFRIHELPEHSPVLWFSDRNAIGAFDFDPVTESLFVLCENQIHRVALDGERLGCWECRYPAGGIKWMPDAQTIWSYCSGIEIISLDGGESRAINQGKFCPYANLAVSSTGEVAAFGGDADIYTPEGDLIRSISGDYSNGAYLPKNRLVLNKFPATREEPIIFVSHDTYDVLSNSGRFAFDQQGEVLVATHWGKLYRFIQDTSGTPASG